MDQTARQSIIDRLQQSSNVLVTVKSDPNVDQLAACIGFTLFLNKINKHATAVFSGKVPPAIDFLKPTQTIEKNTDSLRDFIIALDKSKADKLRYKVEDKVVRIFITPYKTSLSQKDLEFSQGDFNVDVVLALGVQSKSDIDAAITAHGRILHDATVISINNGQGGNVGTLNLEDANSSSLCEMLADLSETMHPDSFDAQMSTAFLTGIVAQTDRFSNQKTSPRTMSLSAKLMAAGANQQLIATKLKPENVAGGTKLVRSAKGEVEAEADADGTLHIEHEDKKKVDSNQTLAEIEKEVVADEQKGPQLPPVQENTPVPPEPASKIGDVKTGIDTTPPAEPTPANRIQPHAGSNLAYEPPTMGGTLTANSRPQDLEPSIDPLGNRDGSQILEHSKTTLGSAGDSGSKPQLDAARQAVEQAAAQGTANTFEPMAAVGAQPPSINEPAPQAAAPAPAGPQPTPVNNLPNSQMPPPAGPLAPPQPVAPPQSPQPPRPLVPPDPGLPPEQTAAAGSPSAPPPVPPPMMPPAQ